MKKILNDSEKEIISLKREHIKYESSLDIKVLFAMGFFFISIFTYIIKENLFGENRQFIISIMILIASLLLILELARNYSYLRKELINLMNLIQKGKINQIKIEPRNKIDRLCICILPFLTIYLVVLILTHNLWWGLLALITIPIMYLLKIFKY